MNRGYLHTKRLRRVHLSVFTFYIHTDKLKVALRAQNVSGAFKKRAPGRFTEADLHVSLANRSRQSQVGIYCRL